MGSFGIQSGSPSVPLPATTDHHTCYNPRRRGRCLSDRLLCRPPAGASCQRTLDKISLSAGRARMRRRKWSAISGRSYITEMTAQGRRRVAVAGRVERDGTRGKWDDGTKAADVEEADGPRRAISHTPCHVTSLSPTVRLSPRG